MEENAPDFNPILLKQITRPEDCYLGIAVPLTLATVQQVYASPEYDLIRSTYPKRGIDETWWEKSGYGEIVGKIRGHIWELRNWGVTVKEGFTLHDLSDIERKHTAVAILAHHVKDRGIELADGIHTREKFAAAIPPGYVGIFDLINCWSEEMRDVVKSSHPACIVASYSGKRDLAFNMFLYKQLIKLLQVKELNYIDAMTCLRKMYAERQSSHLTFLFNRIKYLFKQR